MTKWLRREQKLSHKHRRKSLNKTFSSESPQKRKKFKRTLKEDSDVSRHMDNTFNRFS